MTNYRKSFNFRNGVQVDNDNFVVNPNGLVGIGTSIPSEALDVIGTVKVSGILTASYFMVGGATTFYGSVGVGTQVSVSAAGSITADKYYGDGGSLLNLPTSQWVDTDPGFGYTSIYSAGNVGIATTSPFYTLQIGGGPTSTTGGIGFNSNGNIYSSGIVTASSFYGDGSNLTGIDPTSLKDSSGTVIIQSNSSGSVATGILTSSSVDVTDTISTNQLNVSGISTFNGSSGTGGDIDFQHSGSTRAYWDSSAGTLNFKDGDGITLGNGPDFLIYFDGSNTYLKNNNGISDSDLYIESDEILFRRYNGTQTMAQFTESGACKLNYNGSTKIQTTSDGVLIGGTSNISQNLSVDGNAIVVGVLTVGLGNTSAALRFESAENSFDIINNNVGNISMYLHNGDVGVGTGRFDWIYGQTNQELMSLTYDGNLGLGKTNPDNTLHVVGTSTVTGNAWIGGNLSVTGTISGGQITLPSVISANIDSASGVSTVFELQSLNIVSAASSIGIGTTVPIVSLDARGGTGLIAAIGINTDTLPDVPLRVAGQAIIDSVGIGTTNTGGEGLYLQGASFVQRNATLSLYDSVIYVEGNGGVGVGTTAVRSAVDFADAGKGSPGLLPGEGVGARSFLLPPRLTTAEIVGLSTVEGAFIFNTDTKKFQGYTGVAWTDFH